MRWACNGTCLTGHPGSWRQWACSGTPSKHGTSGDALRAPASQDILAAGCGWRAMACPAVAPWHLQGHPAGSKPWRHGTPEYSALMPSLVTQPLSFHAVRPSPYPYAPGHNDAAPTLAPGYPKGTKGKRGLLTPGHPATCFPCTPAPSPDPPTREAQVS